MNGLVLLAAAAGGSAVGVLAIARAARRRDLVVPTLACDACGRLVSAEVAHRPHEPDCLLLDGCRCDRFVCPSCCDDLACRALNEGLVA